MAWRPRTTLTPMVNSSGNQRQGQGYTTQQAPGGVYHVYQGGRKVFVRAPTAPSAPQAQPDKPMQPQADPGAGESNDPNAGALNGDSQSFEGDANRQFADSQDAAERERERQIAKAEYEEALRRMAERQPKDEQKVREGANKSGLFYSGKLGEQLGELSKEYVRNKADLGANLNSAEYTRQAARRALESGATVEQAASMAQAADRQTGRDTQAADSNSLVLNGPRGEDDGGGVPAVAGRPAAARKPAVKKPVVAGGYKNVVKNGKLYKYYPDGRKVFVRKTK